MQLTLDIQFPETFCDKCLKPFDTHFLKEVSGTEIQRKTNLGIFGFERNYKLIYPASKKR